MTSKINKNCGHLKCDDHNCLIVSDGYFLNHIIKRFIYFLKSLLPWINIISFISSCSFINKRLYRNEMNKLQTFDMSVTAFWSEVSDQDIISKIKKQISNMKEFDKSEYKDLNGQELESLIDNKIKSLSSKTKGKLKRCMNVVYTINGKNFDPPSGPDLWSGL